MSERDGAWIGDAKIAGGVDPNKNTHPLNCDTTGTLEVNVSGIAAPIDVIVDNVVPVSQSGAWNVSVLNQPAFQFDDNGNLLIDSVALRNVKWDTDVDFNKGTFFQTVVVGTGPSALLETASIGGAAPVAWYHLNETSGLVANDSSAFGNPGSISSVSFVAGKLNGAYQFGAAGFWTPSFVSVPNSTSLQITGSISLECWIYITADVGGQLISKEYDEYALNYVVGGDLNFYRGNGAGTFYNLLTTTHPITLNAWHYVVATHDVSTTTATIYVDNIPVATNPAFAPITLGSTTQPVYIGWYLGFNGIMDEVAIYPQALTAPQIAFRWNGGAGTETGLSLTYLTSGTWTSNIFDSGAINQLWGFFDVSQIINAGETVTIQAHATNDLTSWPAYGSALVPGQSVGLNGQFIQFKISFTGPTTGTASVDYISCLYSYPPVVTVSP